MIWSKPIREEEVLESLLDEEGPRLLFLDVYCQVELHAPPDPEGQVASGLHFYYEGVAQTSTQIHVYMYTIDVYVYNCLYVYLYI